jgi:hypothetical protein
MGKEFV